MKKRIQLTENQIISAIREAFEDNQDWRTDMLKGKRKMRQWARPHSKGFGESIVHKVTEGVIRKLNEMRESGFDFLTDGDDRVIITDVSEIDDILEGWTFYTYMSNELKQKVKNGDLVICIQYNDYYGTIVDKAVIEYLKENYPENIIATTASYQGQVAYIFGKEDVVESIITEAIYDSEYIQNLEDDLVQERIKEIERDYKIQLDDETWQELREFLHEFHCEPNFVDCSESEIEEFLSKKGLLPEGQINPTESIVRKVTENVIRKLNEENEEVGKRDDRAGIFIAEILKGYDGLLESWGMPKIKFIPFGVYLSGVNGKTFQGDIKEILNPDTNMFEVSFIQDGKVVDEINSYGASVTKKMTQKINGNVAESIVHKVTENVMRNLNEEIEYDGDSVENFDFNKIAIDLANEVEGEAYDIKPDDNRSYTIDHDWSFADGSSIYATIDASYDCVVTYYSRGDYYQPPEVSGYTSIYLQSEPKVTIWDANDKQWPEEKVAELNIDWSPLDKLGEIKWG